MPAGLGVRAGVFTGACAAPLAGERPFETTIQHEFAAVATVVVLAAVAAAAFLLILRRHRPGPVLGLRPERVQRSFDAPKPAVLDASLRPALFFLVVCAIASLFLLAIGPVAGLASGLAVALPASLGLFYGLRRLAERASEHGDR
ncbi:MAG: hypothetical protein HKP27_15440 [Myxococcales bacterium]|nr:hypothetical protein [Myxococcales bacterium]